MSEVLAWDTVFSSKIMAVAIKRVDGRDSETRELLYCWSVLIKDVPGNNHAAEVELVTAWGNKTSLEFATLIFPRVATMAKKEHWRFE